MSQQVVLEIIEKAMNDEVFRNLLILSPEVALADYEDLTDEERQMLMDLDEEKLEQYAGELGLRLTKGSWLPPGI
ncbi:MAG: hypothetical protein KJ063_06215 [Anaerolineae bacterium]|nr:hypothetical protein [Anaerolineae bacterium]